MSAGPASLAVFDLDGTLSFRDTFAAFVAGYLRRHPARLIGTPGAALALAAWCVGVLDRGQLKSRLIRAFMGGDSRQDIEHWSRAFSSQLVDHGMRPEALEALQAHRQRGDCLILLSASPDLYVPEIGRLLGMHRRSLQRKLAKRPPRNNPEKAQPGKKAQERAAAAAEAAAKAEGEASA